MKVKLFYSIIADIEDGDVLNAYVENHPKGDINYNPEPELTTEIEPDLLEIEEPVSLFEKVAEICNPNK